jgi:hypothetical protein
MFYFLWPGGARLDDTNKLVHSPQISINGVPVRKIETLEEELRDGIASGLIDLGLG